MTQDAAVDFNSQAVTPDKLVSTVDDPGKYDVELVSEGMDGPAPESLPTENYVPDNTVYSRKRTTLVSRYATLMVAWGAYQVAWDDPDRVSLVIAVGSKDIHYSDNPNNLSTVGIASGVGVGHAFANQVVRLDGFTGPLYVACDADTSPVAITAVTVQR